MIAKASTTRPTNPTPPSAARRTATAPDPEKRPGTFSLGAAGIGWQMFMAAGPGHPCVLATGESRFVGRASPHDSIRQAGTLALRRPHRLRHRIPRTFSCLCLLILVALLLAGCASGPRVAESPPSRKNIRIVLVGDSTVNDQGGWGAGFKQLIDDRIECANYARNGRSSKSFIEEGHWAQALAGGADYVLIQFGHNDMPGKGPKRETDPNTTYRDWMSRYVDESRAAGAVPVLVTSMTRRNFRDGKVVTILGDYAQAVRDLAREKDVPLLDLHAASIDLLNQLGPAESETLGPMVDGRPDRTHLSPKGQAGMAALVANLLAQAVPDLAPHLNLAVPSPSRGQPQTEEPPSL